MYGCGQCMPCRINRRRVWAHRLMLEATQHPVNSFWTLTYSDDHLPLTETGLATLKKEHLTRFLDRLRKNYLRSEGKRFRYYYVGEYGEESERPHYHLALFNYPACNRGVTQSNRRGDCCDVCDSVRDIWSFGRVYSGQLEANSATYICGYITKAWTKKGEAALKGRYQEFAQMSLRPGIGAGFMPEVASALLTHNLDSTLSDVPTSLQHGMSVKPLGRYLTRQLRVQMGKAPEAPPETLAKRAAEMQPLREAAKALAVRGTYSETLKQVAIEVNEGRIRRIESRARVFKKRGSI